MPVASSLALGLLACDTPEARADIPPPPSPQPVVTAPSPEPMSAVVGQPAPDFQLTDTDGQIVQLSQFAGQTVILEWFNPDCPFIVYAHGDEGPLAEQPNTWAGEGYVYLAINSGAPGKQGAGLERNRDARTEYGMEVPVLLDEPGVVGKAYDAKTTPQMYIIDPDGTLRYNGALDNAPRGRVKGDVPINYVQAALNDLTAGQDVQTTETKPYGCSVKYGS